jgi:predicted RNA-binding protein YlxR (DUF448 family)
VYLCRSAECLKKARKSNSLSRSVDTPIPDEVYEALEAGIGGANG